MKLGTPTVFSRKTANVFLALYVTAFCLGLVGVMLVPREEAALRKIALVAAYGFGLPLVVTCGLQLLRRIGIWNGK